MSVIEPTEQPEAGDQSPQDGLAEIIDLLNAHVAFQIECLKFSRDSFSSLRKSLSALSE